MNDSWDSMGVKRLFFLTDKSHTRLYRILDLVNEYCEEVGCEKCCLCNDWQCQIPEFVRDAGEKELLWLLDRISKEWELYEILPNDPLPQVRRIKKGRS